MLFWLLGSFGLASWDQLPIPAAALAAAMIYLMAQARTLNALAMGAEPAAALGVDVRRLRRNLFLVTSLMAGVAVAVSGVIGFVRLVVPHIVRLMVGSDHRRVLPTGVLFGASFMVLGDLVDGVQLVLAGAVRVGIVDLDAVLGGGVLHDRAVVGPVGGQRDDVELAFLLGRGDQRGHAAPRGNGAGRGPAGRAARVTARAAGA